MHLVDGNVTVWSSNRELPKRILHIDNLLGTLERFLNQLVVVRRPIGPFQST